jgi:NTE family protein
MPVVAHASEGNPARGSLAVCLGSGAWHGFAHVGAIRALQRHGVRPDLIVGSSAGAIAGALWAAGLDADEIGKLARDPSWREASTLRWPRFGVGRHDALVALIDRHVGRIERLPLRFIAVATDLATGRSVAIDRGPAGAAVAASAAIPLLYEPVETSGLLLVDGALSAPVPVDAAYAAGAALTLAVDVAYRPTEASVSGIMDVAGQSIRILVNRLIEEQISRATLAVRLSVHEAVNRDASFGAVERAGEHAIQQQLAAIRAMASSSGPKASQACGGGTQERR